MIVQMLERELEFMIVDEIIIACVTISQLSIHLG